MKVAIGADHRGFAHKEHIKRALPDIAWHDVGAVDDQRSDYPLFSQKVSEAIRNGRAASGVLICGSGVGMAIAANRYPKIYAALAWNIDVARQSREHDAANVLVIPSDYVSPQDAVAMVCAWHKAVFSGGRYQQRIDMIDKLPE